MRRVRRRFLIPLKVQPVSYTHLDVYKRQVLEEVPANATAVGVPARVVRVNGVKVGALDQIQYGDPVAQEICRMQYQLTKLQAQMEALEQSLEAQKEQ